MENVILIRHGERGEDYRLTKNGITQVKLMAKGLASMVIGEVSLVSSTALRAIETSNIICKALRLGEDFEKSDYLWSANDGPRSGYLRSGRNVWELANFVEARAIKNNLVIVSHLEAVNDLANHFINKYFGSNKNIRGASYGEGFLFNFPLKSFQYLS